MRDEERVAHDVASELRAVGIDAIAKGEGVHWRVTAGDADTRSIVARCLWHEDDTGLELSVDFIDDRVTAAHGRTRSVEPFLVAVRHWIGGSKLDELVVVAPFVDARKRAARAIAAFVERELDRVTWHLGPEPMYELWIYAEGMRACRVLGSEVTFFVGQVQVASGLELSDVRGAISAWVYEAAPVAALAARGVTLERHAEVLEEDPARWHWLCVVDRIADPEDVLVPLAPLIALLAKSPIVTRFYTYSSLHRLRFSASSHFPWVGDYPIVTPTDGGAILVGDEPAIDLAHAVAKIEAALSASPITPFFGCAADHELPVLAAAFQRAGSHHTPRLLRRQQWTDLGVVHGTRRCTFVGSAVTCIDGDKRSMHECTSLDAAVSISIAFLGG